MGGDITLQCRDCLPYFGRFFFVVVSTAVAVVIILGFDFICFPFSLIVYFNMLIFFNYSRMCVDKSSKFASVTLICSI